MQFPAGESPQSRPDAPPLVCCLVYDGLCTFEYGIATELFGLHRPEFPSPLYRFRSVGVHAGSIRATGGLRFRPDARLDTLGQADLIVIPGWVSAQAPVPPSLVRALVAAHGRGARILTICSGVFVLAATGLLDGRSATTHWRYVETLRRAHPAIRVEPNVLFVDEGRLLTSAGSAAGIDLCLYVIRKDYGQEAANMMARSLVLPAQREGGQAQYVPPPARDPERSGRFDAMLEVFRASLDRDWSVERMADRAGLSPRTLLRRFEMHTGQSPKNWLRAQRLARACQLLETTSLPVSEVAGRSGFSTPENFRLQFRKRYGVSPTRYRSHFRIDRPGWSGHAQGA